MKNWLVSIVISLTLVSCISREEQERLHLERELNKNTIATNHKVAILFHNGNRDTLEVMYKDPYDEILLVDNSLMLNRMGSLSYEKLANYVALYKILK